MIMKVAIGPLLLDVGVLGVGGIHKKIGWHTFLHSFGPLLKANGEDVKTVQELSRHANSRITLDVAFQKRRFGTLSRKLPRA